MGSGDSFLYLCDLGQVPGPLCASFPYSANGTSLPHPSQHQELKEEQAQGEGCGGMGVEEWGRPTPGSICRVGGTPGLHPGKRQHGRDHGAAGMAPPGLRALWLCSLPDQGNSPCFAWNVPHLSASTQVLDTVFLAPGALPSFYAALPAAAPPLAHSSPATAILPL